MYRLLLIFLLCLVCSAAKSELLRFHGSNSIGAKLMPTLVSAWLKHEGCNAPKRSEQAAEEITLSCALPKLGEVQVEIHSHGSSTGFRDLLAGRADVAMSSRPSTEAEIAAASIQGLGELNHPNQEFVIALDGAAVIAHPSVKVGQLTLAQLRAVFSGQIANWRLLGGPDLAIQLKARDEQSGTYELFRNEVLGELALARAERFEDSELLIQSVLATPGSIGFVGVGAIRNIVPLSILDGAALAPNAVNLLTEDYRLSRRLYLYTNPKIKPLIENFLAYATSTLGQAVVKEASFQAMEIQPIAGYRANSGPAEYRKDTENAVRLSINFRFGRGSALLDSRGERDLARLSNFVRNYQNGKGALRLMSFSEPTSGSYGDLLLSIGRADFIAERLQSTGVRVSRVRGYGGALPVASGRSATRNDRVEVWWSPED